MEVRPFIEQLEQFEDRFSGGPGERASQEAMAGLFRRSGYRSRVEGCVCHTNPAVLLFAHSVMLLAGGMWAAKHPIPGLILTAVGLISWIGEARYRRRLIRWFLPKSISSNLIARKVQDEDGDTPRILFVAHGDVARRGLIHNGLLSRAFRGADGRWKMHPLKLVLSMAGLQVILIVLRLPEVNLELLDMFLLVPIAFFLLLTLLSLDWMLPRPAAGANDNGSGLAVVAALAEYFTKRPTRNAEVCFLVTGSREAGCGGMEAFLATFGRQLPQHNTFVVNVDDVGAGTLCFAVGERCPSPQSYHPLLPGLAALLARKEPFHRIRPFTLIGRSDAGVAAGRGYPAITLKGLRRGQPATPVHTARDRIRALNPAAVATAFRFSRALAERIDRQLDEELDEPEERSIPNIVEGSMG